MVYNTFVSSRVHQKREEKTFFFSGFKIAAKSSNRTIWSLLWRGLEKELMYSVCIRHRCKNCRNINFPIQCIDFILFAYFSFTYVHKQYHRDHYVNAHCQVRMQFVRIHTSKWYRDDCLLLVRFTNNHKRYIRVEKKLPPVWSSQTWTCITNGIASIAAVLHRKTRISKINCGRNACVLIQMRKKNWRKFINNVCPSWAGTPVNCAKSKRYI